MIKYLLPAVLLSLSTSAFAQDNVQDSYKLVSESDNTPVDVKENTDQENVAYQNKEVYISDEKFDMNIIKEYQIEYNGVIYTNRIVEFVLEDDSQKATDESNLNLINDE